MGPGVSTVKIANFTLNRCFLDFLGLNKSLNESIILGKKENEMKRWMAPEKLKKIAAYSIECEIFRLIKRIFF